METIYTLHDFFLSSKSTTYILMGLGLIAMVVFWRFLGEERGEDS